MHYCDSCGVSDIFAELKHIPPLFLLSHPMDNHSSGPHWVCSDERGCVRRSRMKMKPGKGITWGGESVRHVLIECCGEMYKLVDTWQRMCNGIEEDWKFTDDNPFPEHRYVCNRCGKPKFTTQWKDLSRWKELNNGLDRR